MSVRRWTPKGAVASSRRKLDAAIARLREVSLEWADVDESLVHEAEERIRDLEVFRDELTSYIQERLDAGEHVGL